MSRSTPWTKQKSSLPSDRIKPQTKTANTTKNKSSSSNQSNQPKTKAVRRLEGLLEALNGNLEETDPQGGCYCLARTHALSRYTPLCRGCGFIVCELNQPQYTCPECNSALCLSESHSKLISQVEGELAQTMAREVADQERAVEEARIAAGAFPSLGASSGTPLDGRSRSNSPIPSQKSHKIISLTGQKKNKVVVSSYTTKPSRPTSRPDVLTEQEEAQPDRIPPPPCPPLAGSEPSTAIPFQNLIDGNVDYVPSSTNDKKSPLSVAKSGTARKNKGKAKETTADDSRR